ncbi:MAG: type II secretion system protein [Clostridia bacterium]|jgi:competence protein ComGC|nr:type II secretion system protein [Clostridia bacterium]
MKKEKPNKTSESGITLIELLVMIVILIILTAVVLRTITGDEPLIGTATDTAQDYKIESYREEISHVVHSEIIAKSAIGETATTGDIADALNKQDWIKTAYVNADATTEVGNITAQVVEGYIYQIYYNSIYGKIEIDYIGKDKDPDDLNALTLTARYEKTVTSIFATAEDKKKGVAKLEIIYKDETKQTKEKPSRRAKIQCRRNRHRLVQSKSNLKQRSSKIRMGKSSKHIRKTNPTRNNNRNRKQSSKRLVWSRPKRSMDKNKHNKSKCKRNNI